MNETCANGCIPSSPRVGCPVHGPKAKPPEPEDLPHPGTGRLLSASPVKPPESVKCVNGCDLPDGGDPAYPGMCATCAWRTWLKANTPPPPEPDEVVCVCMEDGYDPLCRVHSDRSETADLRAQLAAAQARIENLQASHEYPRVQDVVALQAATERAERLEASLGASLAFQGQAVRERDDWKRQCQGAERTVREENEWSQRLITKAEAERDAAIKAKEEMQQAFSAKLARAAPAQAWPPKCGHGAEPHICEMYPDGITPPAPPHGKDAEEERPTLPTDEWVADAQTWAHGAGQESSLRDCLTIACEVSEARWAVEDSDGATAADEIADRIRALCPSAFETLGKTEERPRGYIPREAETLRAQRDALKESYWRQRERVEKLSRATCALLGSDREETLDAYLEDDNLGSLRELVAQRDALQDLIHTAAGTLDIVAASPQDFVTHVLLLREERDELKARLTKAEGLLREYLRPGRNSPEDLDRDTAAFLRKPPEATP